MRDAVVDDFYLPWNCNDSNDPTFIFPHHPNFEDRKVSPCGGFFPSWWQLYFENSWMALVDFPIHHVGVLPKLFYLFFMGLHGG